MPLTPDEVRHAQWLQNRDSRLAFRASREEMLHGSQAAALALRADWQPFVEALIDFRLPVQPDDLESKILANQDLNAS
jgi:hypothetical protein